MSQSVMTSREFNQNTGRAKKAANNGPVIITDHGKPAHVFLKYDEFKQLIGANKPIGELLALPGMEDLELDIPRLADRPELIDLS